MTDLMLLVGPLVAAGYVMRRTGLVREEAATDLSKAVFYFTLPPLIFQALHRAELHWSLLLMPVAAVSLALVGIGVGLALTRAFRIPGPKAGALIIATVFGNTTFLGYPIIQGFYGEDGLTLAIFYDLLGAAMVANTVAVILAGSLGRREPVQARKIIRRIVLLPPVWGMAAGLGLRWLVIPNPVETVIQSMANLTVPLIMLSIGLSLKLRDWRQDLPLVAMATAGRLVVFPLVAWIALRALGFPQDMLQVAVLQAGMPTMFFSLTLALLFGLRKELVLNIIMFSTLLSFLSLPAWHWLLGP